MAYETGTATSMDDLITKLMTFATANGWTQDQLDTTANSAALHKGNIWVSFRWDPAGPDVLSIHQALGYTGGNEPGTHPNDSGNGFNTTTSHINANLDNERCVNGMGNGPYPSYFFFESDASPVYIHIVVEKSTDVFRHFGFGTIFPKYGNWTGGEYAYGNKQINDSPINRTSNVHMLDGLFNGTGEIAVSAPTIHAEGLVGEGGSSKWGQVWGGTSTTPPDDTGGNDKVSIHGGFKGGPIARGMAVVSPAGSGSGLVPMYPIGLFHRETDNDCYFLGFQPDVRGVNIKNFSNKQEVTIGSDVWVFFPLAQRTATPGTDRTYNSGVAYKKVTA